MPTVSAALVDDLLLSLQRIVGPALLRDYLDAAGMGDVAQAAPVSIDGPPALLPPHLALRRLSHHQLVRLYQVAAVRSGDEMMGLWSRPIRNGALKYICRSLIDAPTLERALHRFCQVWNLLLDDYRLEVADVAGAVALRLCPLQPALLVNRFGQMLMLKLAHGILSWLAGRELGCSAIAFGFARPAFASDYPLLFPGPIRFGAACSSIAFEAGTMALPVVRRPSEVRGFLERAPRDWIYTRLEEHALQLQIRALLQQAVQAAASAGQPRGDATLAQVAARLHVSPRTLTRRLGAEGLSFQEIKDGLRRDLAIHALQWSERSLEQIAFDLDFSSVTVFHRAFKHWTGVTPGQYRRTSPKEAPR